MRAAAIALGLAVVVALGGGCGGGSDAPATTGPGVATTSAADPAADARALTDAGLAFAAAARAKQRPLGDAAADLQRRILRAAAQGPDALGVAYLSVLQTVARVLGPDLDAYATRLGRTDPRDPVLRDGTAALIRQVRGVLAFGDLDLRSPDALARATAEQRDATADAATIAAMTARLRELGIPAAEVDQLDLGALTRPPATRP